MTRSGAKLKLALVFAALLPSLGVAQTSSSQASSDAIELIAAKLERALGERAGAYARWQAANPLTAASSATFVSGLPTWETYTGLNWTTTGTAEVASLCFTLPITDGVARSAVVRAAARTSAELVDASCQPIAGVAALASETLGLRVQMARANVLVTPLGTPPGLVSGEGVLEVGRANPSSVTLRNNGNSNLAVRSLQVYSQFTASHNCPAELLPLATCQVTIEVGDAGRATVIGRLDLSVGTDTKVVIPIRSRVATVGNALTVNAKN